ncbi:MAG: leucine-rich repeat domain-containing protein [Flavobacteriales bacterium]|nr:leucine-rich repeat domain-containing protein [Flavobacteriales bacterium]
MKKIIFLFLLLPVIGFAQNVSIPDANFKSYLVNYTSLNTNGDDEIQESEANSFTGKIVVTYDSIADLTGIESFTSITWLDCGNNQITSLDVSANTELETLYCENNELTTLNLGTISNLTSLWCEDNLLESIDVTNNPNLYMIWCKKNNFINLDVSTNIALTSLRCGYNSITNIDLSKNLALTNFESRGGKLDSMDFSSNSLIKYISIYANELKYINVSGLDSMVSLELGQNVLTSIDISTNTSLIDIGISFNNLTSLNTTNNALLESVGCAANSIEEFNFSDNLLLESVGCWGNNMTNLDLSNNTSLTYLHSINCHSMTNIDLRNGNLENLDLTTWGCNSLTCVSVDDTTWAKENWITTPDPWVAQYTIDSNVIISTDCTLGIRDEHRDKTTITAYRKTINIKGKGAVSIFNLTGQQVHQENMKGSTSITLQSGIYLVRITAEGKSKTKKVYLK